MAEASTGLSVIQQFRQESRLAGEFAQTNNAYYQARVRMVKTNSLLLSPMVDLLYGGAIIAVMLTFSWTSQSATIAAGTVYAFLSYVAAFYNPIDSAMDSLSSFLDGVVAGSRVLTILADDTLEPTQQAPANGRITAAKVEIRDVRFTYDVEIFV